MAGLMEYTPEELKALRARNMKQVGPAMKEVFGERVPNARLTGPTAAPAAEAAKGGAGLLGKIGKALVSAPALGAQLMLTPGDLEGSDLTPEQRAQLIDKKAMNADARKAAETVNRVNKGVVAQAMGRQNQPVSLMNPNQPQKPVTVQPTPEEQQAKMRELENKRQVIEKGAQEQLRNSQLSRTKAAEEVVKTDLENRGVQATAEEKQAMVAAEVENMRKMDNNSLAKYLSYALMGAGFLAGGTSQQAGAAFANSFQAGYADARAQAAALRKQAWEEQKWKGEQDYKERDLQRKERDTESNIGYREGRLENDVKRVGILEDNSEFDQKYKSSRLAQFGDALGMDRDRLGLERERLELTRKRTEAQIKKDEAAAKKADTPKVPAMSQKDEALKVQAYFKDKGIKSTDGATQQIAAEVRKLRQHPSLVNATEDELMELAVENIGLNPEQPNWLMDFFGADPKLKVK